jgi:DNA-binding response OmpR family regulator
MSSSGPGARHTKRQQANAGIDLAQVVRPQLAVIDVCLPNVSGYQVALRDNLDDSVAIIFVSGKRTEGLDRVAGFLLGADDYLVKPFEPDELIARALLALRRLGNDSAPGAAGLADELLDRPADANGRPDHLSHGQPRAGQRMSR